MAFTQLRNHRSWSLEPWGSCSDLWCHCVVDGVPWNKDAAHAALSCWLSGPARTPTCPLHGCVRKALRLFFNVILGMKLKLSSCKVWGCESTTFVVQTGMFPWERGFFLITWKEIFTCEKRIIVSKRHMLKLIERVTVTIQRDQDLVTRPPRWPNHIKGWILIPQRAGRRWVILTLTLMTNLFKRECVGSVYLIKHQRNEQSVFWLHHIWPLCTTRHRSGERTAVAGDLLHLSSQLCQDSWTLSLFMASWIQEKASPEPKRRPALSSASPGGWVTISRINRNPGKQSEWPSISLGVCILPNNVWPPHPPQAQRRSPEGLLPPSRARRAHSLTLQEEVNPGKQLAEWLQGFCFEAPKTIF